MDNMITMTDDKRKIREMTGGFTAGKLYEGNPYNEIERADSGRIFDEKSYNFHLYPAGSLQTHKREIASEIKEKRSDVIEALRALSPANVAIETDGGRAVPDMNADTIYISRGEGSRGGNGELGGLFKYIAARKNSIKYELNFMRFYVDASDKDVKTVNCILKAVQFDRCMGEYVNQSEKGCDVCYPDSFHAQSDEELKRTLKRRAGKSFCYNPKCGFDDTAERIAEEFIKFINTSDTYDR